MDIRITPGAVVVGVDGSPASESAVRWAARRAHDTNSPIVIAHAAAEAPVAGPLLNREEGRRQSRAAGAKLTARALRLACEAAPGIVPEVVAPISDPRQLLLGLSANASMVVVGTRGRGPISSLLLGSVSTALAAHALCPVAVVRPDKLEDQGPRPVVAGVDGGPATQAVLELAFDLADGSGRPLEVVHCRALPRGVSGRSGYAMWLRDLTDHEQMLDEAISRHAEKHPDVRFQRRVVEDDPVLALVERSEDAAAVVVGSRGLSWARSVIGSVSRAVVERAHSTVVVVRS